MPSDLGGSVPERSGGGQLGDLRPDEIAARQFSPRLLGVSRKQVRRLVYELAAELDRARRAWTAELLECRRLEKALQATRQGVEESRAQLAAARAQLDARPVQGHEPMDAAPLDGRADAAAGRRLEEIAAAARLRAETIVCEAQRAAADTLRSARTLAKIRLRAVDRSAPWGPMGPHDDP